MEPRRSAEVYFFSAHGFRLLLQAFDGLVPLVDLGHADLQVGVELGHLSVDAFQQLFQRVLLRQPLIGGGSALFGLVGHRPHLVLQVLEARLRRGELLAELRGGLFQSLLLVAALLLQRLELLFFGGQFGAAATDLGLQGGAVLQRRLVFALRFGQTGRELIESDLERVRRFLGAAFAVLRRHGGTGRLRLGRRDAAVLDDVVHPADGDQDAVFGLAAEVALAVDGAVVIAVGLVQFDAGPAAVAERRGADEGQDAALQFRLGQTEQLFRTFDHDAVADGPSGRSLHSWPRRRWN